MSDDIENKDFVYRDLETLLQKQNQYLIQLETENKELNKYDNLEKTIEDMPLDRLKE